MGKQLKNNFIVETKGQCFLCFAQTVSPQRNERTTSPNFGTKKESTCEVQSLQCLSRYVKMDMRKVFVEEGSISQDLRAHVLKSNLKVELCSECSSLNKKLSKLYRQLEKVEMEVGTLLKHVIGKVENKTDSFRKLAVDDPLFSREKIQIIEALRKETVEKCSRKLINLEPTVHIQNLTMKEITNERKKIKSSINVNLVQSSDNMDEALPETFFNINADEETEMRYHKSEPEDYDDYANNDQADNNLDDFDEPGHHQQMIAISLKTELEGPAEVEKQRPTPSKPTNLTDNLLNATPPPIKVVGKIGDSTKKYSIDPVTRKYKCRICPKEYTDHSNCIKHYKSAHLKVKYKCASCEKEFCYKQRYDQHYQNVHMGVRYKCSECDTIFTQKERLKRHRKIAHSHP